MSQIATPPMPSAAPQAPDMNVIGPLTAPPIAPAPHVNASTMVSVNGRSMTVQQAAQLAEQGERDKEEYARVKELAEASKIAFSGQVTDPLAKRANHRKVLMLNGWKAADADAEMDRTYGNHNSQPATQPGPAAPTGTVPQPGTKEFEMLRDATLQNILQNMRTAVASELTANADFQAYAKHIGERDGAEAQKNWVATYTEQAYNRLRAAGSKRVDELGGDVRPLFGDSLTTLARAAAVDVVGQARFNLGDPKRLGKSALALGGEDPFNFQSKPPVAPAVYRPGMHQSELDKAQTDRMTDALCRSVAEGLSPQNI
jgi:hypothetical protein